MCSVRKHEKWLLIESDGVQEVIDLKRVINSAATELAIGSKVTLAGTANEANKTGIILAAARDARTLERLVQTNSQEQSEPVNPPAEEEAAGEDPEAGDFSSTASSWEPSGDNSSSDSDEEEVKPNMRIRQYFNKNGKVLTPSYRVNAIVPNVIPQKNKQNANPPAKKRKRTPSETNRVKTPVVRTVPDSSKGNNNPANDVQIINDITKIDKYFKDIFKLLKQWKTGDVLSNGTKKHELNIENHVPNNPQPKTCRNNKSINSTTINNTPKLRNSVPSPRLRALVPRNRVPTPPAPPQNISTPPSRAPTPAKRVSTTPQQTESPKIIKYESQANDAESDTEEYKSDESNRSDDNILISNKYTTVANQSAPKVSRVEQKKEEKSEWIPIGSGKTRIHRNQYSKINWKSYTVATRTLLLAVFPRKILATHSLTGKRSPAFQNLPPKMCLDQRIVQDVIMEIQDRFHIKENLIRTIITTKCADECKMMRIQQHKRNSVSAGSKKITNIKSEKIVNQTC